MAGKVGAMAVHDFQKVMTQGFDFEGPTPLLGAPLLDAKVATDARAPLGMMNHGLSTPGAPIFRTGARWRRSGW